MGRDFCAAKDPCCANSGLQSQEYSTPGLGLIFHQALPPEAVTAAKLFQRFIPRLL